MTEYPTLEEEIEMLRDQLKDLEEEIQSVRQRLRDRERELKVSAPGGSSRGAQSSEGVNP